MKTALLILGVLAAAIGLLWIGQGLGWILWPKSSLMLKQIQWSWYGTVLTLIGVALIVLSRRT